MVYFNARWYDPSTGRFTTIDPVQDGANWYVYCSNNPLVMVDPTGLTKYRMGDQYYDPVTQTYTSAYDAASYTDDSHIGEYNKKTDEIYTPWGWTRPSQEERKIIDELGMIESDKLTMFPELEKKKLINTLIDLQITYKLAEIGLEEKYNGLPMSARMIENIREIKSGSVITSTDGYDYTFDAENNLVTKKELGLKPTMDMFLVLPILKGLAKAGLGFIDGAVGRVNTLKTAIDACDDYGLSNAGRAFQKHAGRGERGLSIWGKIQGGNPGLNNAGLKNLNEILRGQGKFIQNGKYLEKFLPDGRGVRTLLDGTFVTFLD